MSERTETEPIYPIATITQARDAFEAAFKELFKYISLPPDTQKALKAVTLVRGGSAILEGIPGTGKTTAIEALAKAFGLRMAKITCAPQKVTLEGSFYRLHIPSLIKEGKEEVIWKTIAQADVLFISEINRAPQSFQDELIDLLQYRELEAYGEVKRIQQHALVFLDMNPYRGRVDRAIGDRPLMTILFPRSSFFQRFSLSMSRYDRQTIRDIREEVQTKASLADLLKCQAEVDTVSLTTDGLIYSTLLTESFSACIYNRDQASPDWPLPCGLDPLDRLGENPLAKKGQSAKCTFHGGICSCVKYPLAYRIDEALVLTGKSLAWLEDRDFITQEDMRTSLPWVVGNRLELRDSIAKHWASPAMWVVNELFTFLNETKLEVWKRTFKLYQKLQKNPTDQSSLKQLTAIAAANLEVRPLAHLLGVTVFDTDQKEEEEE